MAAIGGDDHPLDLQVSLRIDADFGDHADDRVVALVDRDAAALALGHRLAPVALLDQHIEHALEVGAVGEQLTDYSLTWDSIGRIEFRSINRENFL